MFRTIPAASKSDRIANGSVRPAPERRLASAKVNLTLQVRGRRPDGYHLIESLVVFADIGDRVEAAPADRLSLTVAGPFATEVPTGDDNLVLRAARALAAVPGAGRGAELRLHKNLPVAAGLGGGSADAAATLRALIALWQVRIDDQALRALALGLGADLPVCLAGRPSIMSGIGEVVHPIAALPPVYLVLANPGCRLETAAVYQRLRRSGPAPPLGPLPVAYRDPTTLARTLAERGNDLQAPAAELVPEIGHALDRLNGAPGCLLAGMSGSGPTCFGLFASPAAASAAARAIGDAEPDWWVRPATVAPVG